MRLVIVLGTVMLAKTQVFGTGFKKSLLGNMCIDYCSHELTDLNTTQILANFKNRVKNAMFRVFMVFLTEKSHTLD